MNTVKFTVGAKRLLTENGWEKDCVLEISESRVVRIARGTAADFSAETMAPGLIDPHIHGGDGFDVMHPTVEQMEAWLVRLAESGVAAVLASPYTGPMEIMRGSLEVIAKVMERQKKDGVPGARLLGAHLEGPFISPNRLGAMEERFVLPPSARVCRQLLEGYESIIREMTLAPEVPGAVEVISLLESLGIRVQAGHCDATWEEGETAFSAGVGSVCHFFNAARPIRHRDPSFLASALTRPEIYCEMIADLVHLHPGAVRLLWRCKGPDRVMLISDAVSTTNLPDGEYLDNGLTVEVRGGASFVKGGGLNGGGTYLPGAVRNLISLGIADHQALRAASANAARWLRIDPGVRVGAEASLTGWDQDMRPLFTLTGGYLHKKEEISWKPLASISEEPPSNLPG